MINNSFRRYFREFGSQNIKERPRCSKTSLVYASAFVCFMCVLVSKIIRDYYNIYMFLFRVVKSRIDSQRTTLRVLEDDPKDVREASKLFPTNNVVDANRSIDNPSKGGSGSTHSRGILDPKWGFSDKNDVQQHGCVNPSNVRGLGAPFRTCNSPELRPSEGFIVKFIPCSN